MLASAHTRMLQLQLSVNCAVSCIIMVIHRQDLKSHPEVLKCADSNLKDNVKSTG